MKKLILFFLISAILLTGCNLPFAKSEPTPLPTATPTLEFVQPVSPTVPIAVYTVTPAVPLSTDQAVLDRAAQVVAALKAKDLVALSTYVHPQLGLRFSAYAAVKDTDQVFQADKLAAMFGESLVINWGAYSATGEPIELTFSEYFSQFVYDVDFANAPQISLNHRLGISTTLDNSQKYYPGSMIVEYYFPSFDPQYEGMDWRSLRLVFQADGNTWYLVGIIHDQWTT